MAALDLKHVQDHPHDIPEPFHWDPSFEVFYVNLDEEHRGLFKGIFDLAEKRDQKHLEELQKRMNDHFKSEEVMMEKAKFEGYDHHKADHDKFLVILKDWSQLAIDDDKLIYAKNWLVKHIKAVDAKYKDKLHHH